MRSVHPRLQPEDLTDISDAVLAVIRQKLGTHGHYRDMAAVAQLLTQMAGQFLGSAFAHNSDAEFTDIIRMLNDQLWHSIRIGQRQHVCEPPRKRGTRKMGPTRTP